MNLIEPNFDYVQQKLRKLDADEQFKNDERTVGLVFRQWPANADYAQVLAKTIVLNRLYSTNIYDVRTVAKHIVRLGIDERLRRGDPLLIEDIAQVPFKKKRLLLSFATKYCSWHQPEQFQIFDSFVERVLWQYQRQFAFATFRKPEIRHYPQFVKIVDKFMSRFGLAGVGRKDLDKFLWSEGQDKQITA